MVRNAVDAAKALGIDARVGNLFSADLFYSPDGEMFDVMEKYGILGVERKRLVSTASLQNLARKP